MVKDIPQVPLFGTTSLRIAGHLQVMQDTVARFKAFRNQTNTADDRLEGKMEAQLSEFISAVNGEDSAYKTALASDYTQRVKDADDARDGMQTLLTQMVDTYVRASWDPEKQKAAQLVQKILKNYNVNTRENYLEESLKIQQQNQELQRNYQAEQALKAIGAWELVKKLTEKNDEVITLIRQRNDERSGQTASALSLARKAADAEYQLMIRLLNAYALTNEDELKYRDLILSLTEDIKYYRQHLVPKSGSGSADPDDEKGDDEKGDDDGGSDDKGGSDDDQKGGDDSGDKGSDDKGGSDDDQKGGGDPETK